MTRERWLRMGLLVLLATLTFGARSARAEAFRYVDRNGREHTVAIDLPGEAQALPPPPEPTHAAPGGSAAEAHRVDVEPLIRSAAKLYALPQELIRAVIEVESGFKTHAVSSVGAKGLMQLRPDTARELGVRDVFDPWQNVAGGSRFLRILINAFEGDVALAIAAYHAGAGAVRRAGGVPHITVTQRYVSMVLSLYHRQLVAAERRRRPSPAGRAQAQAEVVGRAHRD